MIEEPTLKDKLEEISIQVVVFPFEWRLFAKREPGSLSACIGPVYVCFDWWPHYD